MPNRQDAPHPHEAVLDPTQQYVLINDLGADLVRVYAVDPKTNLLTAKPSLKAKAGSGPRHAAFTLDPVAGHYVFYLVAEIASTVTAYRVMYADGVGGMTFEEIGVYSTLAPGEAIPATTTGESTGVAAEVAVSVSIAVVAWFFSLCVQKSSISINLSFHLCSTPPKNVSLDHIASRDRALCLEACHQSIPLCFWTSLLFERAVGQQVSDAQ